VSKERKGKRGGIEYPGKDQVKWDRKKRLNTPYNRGRGNPRVWWKERGRETTPRGGTERWEGEKWGRRFF